MGKAMRLTEAKIRSLTSQGREYKEYFHEPTPAAGIRVAEPRARALQSLRRVNLG